jgi:hypothetical protein
MQKSLPPDLQMQLANAGMREAAVLTLATAIYVQMVGLDLNYRLETLNEDDEKASRNSARAAIRRARWFFEELERGRASQAKGG